jgi:hypothetical protein
MTVYTDVVPDMTHKKKTAPAVPQSEMETAGHVPGKIRFEFWGEEMLEKQVKASSGSGRVYLPPRWVGRTVKIIRID